MLRGHGTNVPNTLSTQRVNIILRVRNILEEALSDRFVMGSSIREDS